METFPKIFLWAIPSPSWGGVIGCAMTEDGTGLVNHCSSSVEYAKMDLGYIDVPGPGQAYKKKVYDVFYPSGYELVWLDDPESNPKFVRAFEINEENSGGNHS